MSQHANNSRSRLLGTSFFERDAPTVARDLIGATLLVDGVGGKIVEVEAYDEQDPASHSFRGPTPRNSVMFGKAGHAYIYLIYGLHCCLNVVCGPEGSGSAVLIRALEPTSGVDKMFMRRDGGDLRTLCAGPGRLSNALGIDLSFNALPVDHPPIGIFASDDVVDVVASPRVGISRAKETAWRFAARGSPFLSRPVSMI